MPKVNDKRIVETVHIMEPEWLRTVEETGDLTLDDMRRSLKNRYMHGDRDIVVAREEKTLLKMNWYLIGELLFDYGTLH